MTLSKIVFSNIYFSKEKAAQRKEIMPWEMTGILPIVSITEQQKGAPVAYIDNTGEVVEANFLCHGQEFENKPTHTILTDILSTEDELREFCLENKICDYSTPIFK